MCAGLPTNNSTEVATLFATYYWYDAWISAYIPGASGVAIYALIYWKFGRNPSQIESIQPSDGNSRTENSTAGHLTTKRFRATARLLAMTYIVDVLLIVPGNLLWGLGLYYDFQYQYPLITATADLLHFSTTVSNPIVYAIVSSEIRSAFLRTIKCKK